MEKGREFKNVYDDEGRASAYAQLEFPGTYFLAFRDLRALIAKHVTGKRALDFGCGAGRSTRWLRDIGFDAVGIDISRAMVDKARALDPAGDYRLVAEADLGGLEAGTFDLVFSAFTFDNIPDMQRKEDAFGLLSQAMADDACIVNVVSSPDIYVNEWASFSTKDYPDNRLARSGDRVYIVMLDVEDRRPVEEILCSDEDYRSLYHRAGLTVLETHRPLATGTEPITWVSEKTVAPWVIYVLRRSD